MKEILIDARHAILGRLASFAAKKALEGNSIVIVNSQKAIIIGNKSNLIEKFKERIARGKGSLKGPYISRSPEQILRRAIRGMLPWKKSKGKEAYRRIKCFLSIPKKYEKVKKIVSKPKYGKFISLEQLSKLI